MGSDTLDDAAVLRVSDDQAVVFTADFITPLVDDARMWGRVAAANSLSDVYAMGARPLAALNLVGWPSGLPADQLLEVLQGGAEAAAEAGCLVVGGHSVADREPKYGMAVIGLIHPEAIVRNRGAQPGDLLYLTKPLGTGVLATAFKGGVGSAEQLEAAVACMTTLNRSAAEAAVAAGAHAMTDVTGFGLAGHLTEMLGTDTGLGARLSAAALPLLPGVREQIAMGMLPGGAHRNREAYASRVHLDDGALDGAEMILFDPQTSGGLLVALPPTAAASFEASFAAGSTAAACIGRFTTSGRVEVVSS